MKRKQRSKEPTENTEEIPKEYIIYTLQIHIYNPSAERKRQKTEIKELLIL